MRGTVSRRDVAADGHKTTTKRKKASSSSASASSVSSNIPPSSSGVAPKQRKKRKLRGTAASSNSPSVNGNGNGSTNGIHGEGVDLGKLSMSALKLYKKKYHLKANSRSKQELIKVVSKHWSTHRVEEEEVLKRFLASLKARTD
ncbi:hypothetical protein QOT17_012913 [Balamuthia mandrillaris]